VVARRLLDWWVMEHRDAVNGLVGTWCGRPPALDQSW